MYSREIIDNKIFATSREWIRNLQFSMILVDFTLAFNLTTLKSRGKEVKSNRNRDSQSIGP